MLFPVEERGRQWLWGWGHSLCCSGLGFILRSILTAPTLFSMIISKQQCSLKIYYSPSHFLPWPEKWRNNEKIHISPWNIWLWSPFSLTLCSWGHFTPGASWVPVALPCLLPEQITEAVLPWEQSGPPRAVTGQLHRKDSAPEQWNRAVRIWSPPSTKCGPLGVEMATPQPSWRQTTLALARLQWEAQSTLHRPEMFISTCPSHWQEPFVMSRTSEYAGRRRQSFSKITWLSHLNKVFTEVKGLTCISPEQTTWAAPLWWQVPAGQGTLGQTLSSGSSPSHLNSSAQTRPSDSLKSSCPRTDTALPHPSSAQMTWAVGSVKFPSDTGVQTSPECTSTRPEQGPSPPARRTNPKRKQQNQWVFMVLTSNHTLQAVVWKFFFLKMEHVESLWQLVS